MRTTNDTGAGPAPAPIVKPLQQVYAEATEKLEAMIEAGKKATPRPWSTCRKGDCKCGLIWGADGNTTVAVAQGPMHLESEDSPDCVPDYERQQANARLLTLSANLCPGLAAELLAQLKTAWTGCTLGDDRDQATGEKFVRRIARACGVE